MEQMLLRPRRRRGTLAVLLLQLAVLRRRPRVRPPTVGGRLSGGRIRGERRRRRRRCVVCGDSPLSPSSLAKGRFPRRRHDHSEIGQRR